jgi:hypothetical protein
VPPSPDLLTPVVAAAAGAEGTGRFVVHIPARLLRPRRIGAVSAQEMKEEMKEEEMDFCAAEGATQTLAMVKMMMR